jgi:adenylate cyclase, class 2
MGEAERAETEVKLRVESVESARHSISGLGAFLAQPRHFEDNLVFDDERGELSGKSCLLRLRTTPTGNTVTFKGPRSIVEGVKRREEIECRVDDAAALRLILERLGLRVAFRYQKYREVYEWDEVEIVIDETPIGVFIEIEGAVADIHETAEALGFGAESYVVESYAALFFAEGGRGDMVFA